VSVRIPALLAYSLFVALSIGSPTTMAGQKTTLDVTAPPPSLPPSLRAAIDRLADSARALGLPTEPLYLKAAEGVLKHAPEDRVSAVVSRLLGELTESRRALGADATSAEVMAGASVVHAGVESAVLRRVQAARGKAPTDNSLVMALVVLADLVARHVTPDLATESVTALVERRAPDQEFAGLRSHVEREIGQGRSPDDATRGRTAAILRGLSAAQRGESGVPASASGTRP
jgi:hypothetical protein